LRDSVIGGLSWQIVETNTHWPGEPGAPYFVREWLAYGACLRAAQYLVPGGKACALTRGRAHVGFEDVRALAHPALRHRILRNFHAESGRVSTDAIVDRLLEADARCHRRRASSAPRDPLASAAGPSATLPRGCQ
jgi:hypothetical protein